MVVVDFSGWIQFFTDRPKADAYDHYLKDLEKVATPAIDTLASFFLLYNAIGSFERAVSNKMARAVSAYTPNQTVASDAVGLA